MLTGTEVSERAARASVSPNTAANNASQSCERNKLLLLKSSIQPLKDNKSVGNATPSMVTPKYLKFKSRTKGVTTNANNITHMSDQIEHLNDSRSMESIEGSRIKKTSSKTNQLRTSDVKAKRVRSGIPANSIQ